MPNNDPYQNAPHLQSRLAVATGATDDGARFDNWGGAAVPQIARTMHRVWAGEYVRLLSEGDTGAAFSHLHHLRYEEPDADPWRLLELVAKRALAAAPAAEAPAESAPAAVPSPVFLAAPGSEGSG